MSATTRRHRPPSAGPLLATGPRHVPASTLRLGIVLALLGLMVPLAVGAATAPASAAAPEAGLAGAPGRALVLRTLEDQVIALTNVERRAHGCGDLKPSARLRVSARRHTIAMADADEMSHQLPGEPYFSKRITRAGYRGWRLVAENVAHGFEGPAAVMAAWMASPGHRRNILNCKLRDIGVGVVQQGGELWWTQNFGRR